MGAVTSAAGLDGEAVSDVNVLERFSFLSVPASEADRVIEALDGRELGGRELALGARQGLGGTFDLPRARGGHPFDAIVPSRPGRRRLQENRDVNRHDANH